MKSKIAASIFIVGSLMTGIATHAADADTERAKATTFVKDSAITVKVKAKLAAEKISSLAKIQVDTDNKGVVMLSGKVKSREEADKAASIAQATEGVTSVMNHIQVSATD